MMRVRLKADGFEEVRATFNVQRIFYLNN